MFVPISRLIHSVVVNKNPLHIQRIWATDSSLLRACARLDPKIFDLLGVSTGTAHVRAGIYEIYCVPAVSFVGVNHMLNHQAIEPSAISKKALNLSAGHFTVYGCTSIANFPWAVFISFRIIHIIVLIS